MRLAKVLFSSVKIFTKSVYIFSKRFRFALFEIKKGRERERSNLIKQLFQSDDFFQTTKDYYTFFHRSFSQHHLIFVTVPSFFPFSFFPFFPFSLFFPHCIDIPVDENRMRIFTKPRNVRLKFARIFPITAIPSFPICFLTLSPPSRNYVHPKRDVRVFFEIVCAKSGERREYRDIITTPFPRITQEIIIWKVFYFICYFFFARESLVSLAFVKSPTMIL